MSTRPAILFALLLAILLLAVVVPSLPAQLRVEIIARGLEVPWDLAVAPDGRIFVTERPGRLRVIRDGRLEPQPVAQLPVAAVSESGLMGLAIAPRFAESGHLYVC
ncbi:MAG: PQQ-dependent sugar dehydrogenase, partial [Candidatus Rokubacteria bacterium]|nr:PQQ-dependent sugar dehydrogenase [Candidatus Rokubacteria bacterium]